MPTKSLPSLFGPRCASFSGLCGQWVSFPNADITNLIESYSIPAPLPPSLHILAKQRDVVKSIVHADASYITVHINGWVLARVDIRPIHGRQQLPNFEHVLLATYNKSFPLTLSNDSRIVICKWSDMSNIMCIDKMKRTCSVTMCEAMFYQSDGHSGATMIISPLP